MLVYVELACYCLLLEGSRVSCISVLSSIQHSLCWGVPRPLDTPLLSIGAEDSERRLKQEEMVNLEGGEEEEEEEGEE